MIVAGGQAAGRGPLAFFNFYCRDLPLVAHPPPMTMTREWQETSTKGGSNRNRIHLLVRYSPPFPRILLSISSYIPYRTRLNHPTLPPCDEYY